MTSNSNILALLKIFRNMSEVEKDKVIRGYEKAITEERKALFDKIFQDGS